MELYPIDLAIHLVNIVVLYILLRVLVWKPVRKFMAARQDRVQAEMDRASQLQAEAEKSKADYDARLAQVENTCRQMLAEFGDMTVIGAAAEGGARLETTLSALLPDAFGSDSLKE